MQHARSFVWMSWVLRLIVAVILVQTLFFKFTAARESVYIFSTLGMEPWGRVGSGVFELVASILLLIPSTITLGAAMAVAATGSAILFHLFRVGIALTVVGDHGELLALANRRGGVLARHPPASPAGVAVDWTTLHHHVTGSASRPRSIMPRRHRNFSGATPSLRPGMRCKSALIAICPSKRASGAPRQ